MLVDGRHLVIRAPDGPHHLWVRASANADQPLAVMLIADQASDLRRQAAERLMRLLAGIAPLQRTSGFQPSAFQRQRLNLLLALIDRQQASPTPVPLHELAGTLVYPGMRLGRGAAWKASNERRRTQRLLEEAHALMAGGYRALLRGEPAGATKTGS